MAKARPVDANTKRTDSEARLTTKKSANGEGASPAKKSTTKRAGAAAETKRDAKRPARRVAATPPGAAAKPRIRASHSTRPDAPVSRAAGGRPLKAISVDGHRGRGEIKLKSPGLGLRKAPLTGPKRAIAAARAPRPVDDTSPGPSTAAKELALALAAAAIDKKAVGIEILDVTGKVDYADFLVVMTGRSDRHVHSIATGIEEAMRRRKLAPLSMEGLSTANWVLIDFSDVVVHVFQEEARALYDIEGLWIDAGRVPVPDLEKTESGPSGLQSSAE
jgi:ribosome-associated protein